MPAENMRRERLDEIVAYLVNRGGAEDLRISADVYELYKSRDAALYWMLSVCGFNAPVEHVINDFKRRAIAEWIAQDYAGDPAHDRATAWANSLPGSTPPEDPL